jgi:hypothetical protein
LSREPNGRRVGSNTPKRLVLHFVRDVGAADLNKAWDEGFEANAKAQLPALKQRVETLKRWMATFTHKPGGGTQVNVGGAAKGTIEGDDFARSFLSIWLGTKPPNAGLKAGLLGGPCP